MRPLMYNPKSDLGKYGIVELMVSLDVVIVASEENIEDMQDEPWDETLMVGH